MQCRVTSKNQLTLPKEVADQFKNSKYFDARIENGRIVLEPMVVRPVIGSRLKGIRERVASRGPEESELDGIIAEVRHARRP